MTHAARRPPLAAAVRGRLRRAGAEAAARLRHQPLASARCPPLRGHVAPLAEAAMPYLLPCFARGGNRAARQILAAVGRGKHFRPAIEKMGSLTLRLIFDALHPLVGEAVRVLAFTFAQSTLATLTREVNVALALLRGELLEGLQEGEGMRELARRVLTIFGDPARAETIARTEAQRAVYAGEVMAARQSGVVTGLKWLAAPACCDACQALDGKVVPLGAPFATGVGKNPAYSVILHPPYHPNCRCSVTQVIDPRYLP